MTPAPDQLSRPIRRPAPDGRNAPLISRALPANPIWPGRPSFDAPADPAPVVPGAAETPAAPLDPVVQTQAAIREQALAVLAKLQTQTVTRAEQLRVFALSLVAFIVVGWLLTLVLKGSTGTTLLGVLLVLVIHESGHYLAMRYFGYRNLKMFFIPLFGAAVSGYGHGSVVQSAVIFLAGPLPGILIGYGCGLIFFQTRVAAWGELAQLFVIINALNLLPVFPLDGGRFVFDMLPPRTARWQWVLQGLIAAGLFALTFVLHITQFSSFAGIALGGILHLTRANNLAQRVRTSPINLAASDTGQIPVEVAADLIDVISDEAQSDKPKELAELAWQTWTQVTARRPTRRQALGLWAFYLLTLSTVLLARAIFVAAAP